MHTLAELTPREFEDHVRDWLVTSGANLEAFEVTRLEKISGSGGDYEIDVVVRLCIFGGADLTILVECKHHKNPIKRDVIMVLESKLRDTKAHKGMVFSTCAFQSGALDFAKVHGIATLQVADSGTAYCTKSFSPIATHPMTAGAVAWLCEPSEAGHSMSLVSRDEGDVLAQWLHGQ